jgi:predicted O-methyltransferase YrrM
MSNFNLTTIRPKGFPHASAFNEVRNSLAWALSSLGHKATETENWIDASDTNIIFGAELLAANQPQAIPAGSILYNLEQPSHPCFPKVQAIAKGSRCTVWDYSLRNVKLWAEFGAYARHVPIGYTPNLTVPPAACQDIDVLFFGCMTPRRNKIIEDMHNAGIKVYVSDNCYGGGRDNLISRAKICLNIHHDGRTLFEIVRCSYLMANYKTVITEVSEDDEEYSDLSDGLIRCTYEDIVETVKKTLDDMPFGFYAHQAIARRDYISTVQKALTALSPQEKVAQRYSAGCADGDMKDFLPWLREHAKGTVLEIGVRDGASTSAFLAGLERNGGVLLSIDTQNCEQLFAGHPQWKFIQSSSQNPKLHAPELDVVLVDGDHTRSGYRADLDRYFPLVKPGGLIISHDIDPQPGQTLEDVPRSDFPSMAIREEYFNFCAEHSLVHEELPGKYGLGVMKKSEVIDSDESWQASEAICK